MPRLNWSATGERFYEAGVDRGVLYVGELAGVPWPGLVSVSESPRGGEARPFYIDGFKYANVAASEEFEATISAFQSPPEFATCDGVSSVHNGLFATQQPRKPFGLSYRTKLGNDTEGVDFAYKIHLVYNALAAPAGRSNNTMGQQLQPNTLSWAITTLPPAVSGLRPTAHFVIDSRNTPSNLLKQIEDVLYGSAVSTSRLPSIAELLDLFNNYIDDPYGNLVRAANPLAWYRGDGTAVDETGGAVGELIGTYGSGLLPIRLSAQSFSLDGVDDTIFISQQDKFALTDAICVETWFVADSFIASGGGYNALFSQQDIWTIELVNGCPEFFISTDNGFSEARALNPIQTGALYHLVGTYDGSNIRTVLNGTEVAVTPFEGILTVSNTPLFIGSWSAGSGNFHGRIAESVIYDRVPTMDEIIERYNIGLSNG